MSDQPLLSIIIVSYATRSVLRDCLLSVRREVHLPHETIVVDNASPDGSADMVEQEFPEMILLRNAQNVGFSPANNLGMERARARYILLLNPDTLVRTGSIEAWVEAHERLNAGISGPRLVGTDGNLQISSWRVPGLLEALLELFMLHRVFGLRTYPEANFTKEFQGEFVSGAAMLFARDIESRVGGLDPEMFWMEDADLCERIRTAGGTCWYVNGPGIVHIGGESSKRNLDRVIPNQLLSRIKFARKHRSTVVAFLIALVMVAHGLTRALAFSVKALFMPDPRARAYRLTVVRLFRYLVYGDRSI